MSDSITVYECAFNEIDVTQKNTKILDHGLCRMYGDSWSTPPDTRRKRIAEAKNHLFLIYGRLHTSVVSSRNGVGEKTRAGS